MVRQIDVPVLELHSAGKALLEGPRYVSGQGLVFADARGGGVFRLSDGGAMATLWAHRRGIGGLIPHASGGYVVTGRNLAYRRTHDSPTTVIVEQDPDRDILGFNDLTVDGQGRIYVGSVGEVAIDREVPTGERKPGGLYFVDLDGSARLAASDIQLSNGTALSPDGRCLYLSDTDRGVVLAWDVEPESGELTRRRTFLALSEGAPDGMAVAEDGCLWIAAVGAGKVLQVSPEGVVVGVLEVPVKFVTSVCFGGPDGRTLFIVSGAETERSAEDAGVYSVRLSVRGLTVPPTRVLSEPVAK